MASNKNYAGIPDKYARIDEAKVVLIPVPYMEQVLGKKEQIKGRKRFSKLQKTWNCLTSKPELKFTKKAFT